MTYRRFTFKSGGWMGTLYFTGWATFHQRTKRLHHNVSMKAVAATQEQAEAYVKAKTDSLARGEPLNTYIPVGED